MNNLYNILAIFLVIVFTNTALFSQNNGGVKVLGKFDSQSQHVKLRWAPTSQIAWETGLQNGYTIIRYTYAQNDTLLSVINYNSSKVILDSSLTYLPEIEWDTLSADSNVIGFGKASIFEDSLDMGLEGGNEMINAYNLMNVKETKYNFGLLAADRSFVVAEYMGLAFIDSTIVVGNIYNYRVFLNSDSLSFGLGSCRVDTDSVLSLQEPLFRLGYGINTKVFLEWTPPETENDYLGYFVERSDDMGVTYQALNILPIATVLKEEGGVEIYGTVDSVPAFLTTYVYRIRGVNLWEDIGPWSDTLHIYTLPPKVAIPAYLANVAEVYETDNVFLEWEFPDSLENKINGFHILRSDNIDGPFDTIALNLTSTVRDWSDNTPINTAYYKVRVVDIHDYLYDSHRVLYQKNDLTPPAPPAGLIGTCDKSGRIKLNWAPPIDLDVAGYRVFSTYNKTGDWAEHTTQPVRDSSFSFFIDIKKLNREVFVKVQAVDLRANYSEFSDTLAVEIPDIVAPSSPQLISLGQHPFGQVIEFKKSPSDDVEFHIIERRNEFVSQWEAIHTLESWQTDGFFTIVDSEKGIFIDTSRLKSEPYAYRVLAVDFAENRSSSEMQEIIAHQVGRRPEVAPVTVVSFEVNGNTFSCLRWDYDNPDHFQDFVIYRKVNNHPYKSYKATQGTAGEMNETWPGLTPPSGYGTYLFADLLLDEKKNLYGTNEPVEVVRYKIIGRHYDGSSSPYSQVVVLEF